MDKEINVKRIAIHHLIKEEGKPDAKVDYSDKLLDIDKQAINLIEKLDDSYKTKEIVTYAVFEKDKDKKFPEEFSKYIKLKAEGCSDNIKLRTDTAFLAFSKESSSDIKKQVTNIYPAKGGYLVFSEYEINNGEFLSVFLIRNTSGMLFKKDTSTSTFKINPTIHLDLDKLAMACKVDVNNYSNSAEKYLSFIKGKQNDISQYFIKWISAVEIESNKTFTDDFYKLIDFAKCPKDYSDIAISRDLFQKQVYDDYKSSPKKRVNLIELSKKLYNEPKYLINLAEKKKLRINTEFLPNNRVMKNFIQIEIESDGIKMRFSRAKMEKKIFIENNTVIIKSVKFAKTLKEELKHEKQPTEETY